MAMYKILAASYTNSIFSLSFTPSSLSLTLEASTEVGPNPSWIEPLQAANDTTFVIAQEKEDGEIVIVSFSDVLKEGKIIGRKSLSSRDPCHVCVIPGENSLAITANYSSGSVDFLPLSFAQFDEYRSSACVTLPYMAAPSPPKVAHRQEASHAHQAVYVPEYKEVLIPDLGSDRIWRLARDSRGWDVKGEVVTEAGGGPRHIVYYGGHLYVLFELSNSLGVYELPPLSAQESPRLIQVMHSLDDPPSTEAQKEFGKETNAAELLLIPPSSNNVSPLLYFSTRNIPGPDGDIITTFSIDRDGKVAKISETKTGLSHLRALSFSPDHRYLIAAGVLGGGVKIYERKGSALEEIVHLLYENGLEKVTGFAWA